MRHRSVIPGFGLTLGFTLSYLGVLVIVPLAALLIRGSEGGWTFFWNTVTDSRVVHSYKLTLLTATAAALVNMVFGSIIAWTLVRYTFPGKRLVDAIVDLPFALPTAVSGIALTAIYGPTGWIGQYLFAIGIPTAYSPLGITIALTFVGLPFVVRTVQPALQDLDAEIEEAASVLGANRWQTFVRVIVPVVLPSLLTGFALSLARALGEYGSVVFISGNLPGYTEITPQMIFVKLEQFDYTGAAAIASVMLIASFFMLLTINLLQWWTSRHQRKDA
jgi:sulfate/thiosulfate transport system permease protein